MPISQVGVLCETEYFPFPLYPKLYLRFLSFTGSREKELGSNTTVIRGIKYIAVGTVTIHFMACLWYSLACHNAGTNIYSCETKSWAMTLKTGGCRFEKGQSCLWFTPMWIIIISIIIIILSIAVISNAIYLSTSLHCNWFQVNSLLWDTWWIPEGIRPFATYWTPAWHQSLPTTHSGFHVLFLMCQ